MAIDLDPDQRQISEEERQIRECLRDRKEFETDPDFLKESSWNGTNPVPEDEIGPYFKIEKDCETDPDVRQDSSGNGINPGSEDEPDPYVVSNRRVVTDDLGLIQEFAKRGKIPGFLAAGPRDILHFKPDARRYAVVTSGGVCPGLNTVVDAIVRRHWLYAERPVVLGFTNGFRGFVDGTFAALTPNITDTWPRRGGSMLRQLREQGAARPDPEKIVEGLLKFQIDILYIAGGDGSLKTAQEVLNETKQRNLNIAIVHIPKTMDNDIPWISESFGFQTAISEAARLVNAIRDEAQSNNRIGIVEVLGAGMGHTAAFTALASGEIDVVLIPEQGHIDIDKLIDHLYRRALGPKCKGYAVVLAAEKIQNPNLELDNPSGSVLVDRIEKRFRMRNVKSRVFVNQPKHYIRAVPANCQDQLYCRQLANCAVDCAVV